MNPPSILENTFEVMFSRKGVLPVDMINVPNCSDELQLSYNDFFQSEHAEHRRLTGSSKKEHSQSSSQAKGTI